MTGEEARPRSVERTPIVKLCIWRSDGLMLKCCSGEFWSGGRLGPGYLTVAKVARSCGPTLWFVGALRSGCALSRDVDFLAILRVRQAVRCQCVSLGSKFP